MATLLFEIGTEELPSWYVAQAETALGELVETGLKEVYLPYGQVKTFATPRRLAVKVSGVASRTETRLESRRGPSASVAFDDEGNPSRAALGFAASNGISADRLATRETDKGRYVYAELERGGEAAEEVLPAMLRGLVGNLPAPRKMRWADVETPFVRPVAWLVALFDETVLPLEAAGQTSGRTTQGHRFLGPGAIELESAESYPACLETAYVLAERDARKAKTRVVVEQAAREAGFEAQIDEALLDEVSDLIEWPVAVFGTFDRAFLDLPEDVLSRTMMKHQRFFPLREVKGGLAAGFVGVSNNQVADDSVIRKGYEEVLAGRLQDAGFFWQADRRKSLRDHAENLRGIAFQKQLGTMADKVVRVGKSAAALAERLEVSSAVQEVLEGALPVFRADLATQMIYEDPELEGVMARAYAQAEGYPDEVARALEDGVRPTAAGATLPESEVGALLAAADRADKLMGFFAVGKRPSGSADPFGLRRDAVALARILTSCAWPLSPLELFELAAESYGSALDIPANTVQEAASFLWNRVEGLLADEGLATLLVRAAVADDPPVITAARRAHLLEYLARDPRFEDLMTLYKRAANLANEASEQRAVNPNLFTDSREAPLYRSLQQSSAAFQNLLAQTEAALDGWDLGQGPALRLQGLDDLDDEVAAALALKEPLDDYMDNVLIMVDDEAIRDNRLALLGDVRDAMRGLGRLEVLEGR